jgi:3-oxoacyl-(acyl-carrier-protein) synthase
MEWALRDARDLIRSGKAKTVLVGCHDEAVELVDRYRASAGLSPMPEIYSHSILLKAE